MRKTTRTLVLLMMIAALIGCFAFGVSAAEFEGSEDALSYLDGYADNVGTDANFAENISAALAIVREEISGYGTFQSLLPPIIAIALALITKEVYSSLFIGILAGGLLAAQFNPSKTMDAIIGDGLIDRKSVV